MILERTFDPQTRLLVQSKVVVAPGKITLRQINDEILSFSWNNTSKLRNRQNVWVCCNFIFSVSTEF